jgi:hypothetical protein
MRTVDPAADADDEMHLWEDILHIYESLAQTCVAAGLNPLAACYYGLCANAITHLPPRYIIDESPYDNETVLTASRFLAMTLNQQATELVTAGDHTAALEVLRFSQSVVQREVDTLSSRRVPPGSAAKFQRDEDDLVGLLAYCLSQSSCCALELRNRRGLHELKVPTVTWEPPKSDGCDRGRRRRHTLQVGDPQTLQLAGGAAAEYARKALEAARGSHIDSVLQAAFSLGDVALSGYDLAEAMRILSIVALVAAHGQVNAQVSLAVSKPTSATSSCPLGYIGFVLCYHQACGSCLCIFCHFTLLPYFASLVR